MLGGEERTNRRCQLAARFFCVGVAKARTTRDRAHRLPADHHSILCCRMNASPTQGHAPLQARLRPLPRSNSSASACRSDGRQTSPRRARRIAAPHLRPPCRAETRQRRHAPRPPSTHRPQHEDLAYRKPAGAVPRWRDTGPPRSVEDLLGTDAGLDARTTSGRVVGQARAVGPRSTRSVCRRRRRRHRRIGVCATPSLPAGGRHLGNHRDLARIGGDLPNQRQARRYPALERARTTSG